MILWFDPVARRGDASMAVDEALLRLGREVVLRVYRWSEPTVTYGYFDREEEAREIFPDSGIQFTRRWTGGGIVDHRTDYPFSLVLPHASERAGWRSAELYRWIHGELARVLTRGNIAARVLGGNLADGGRACFASPVESDLVSESGNKIAGGGQRRTRDGVLHQGSIQECEPYAGWAEAYAAVLAETMGLENWRISREAEPVAGMQELADRLEATRYGTPEWKSGARK